ncbi:cytochrome P450 2D4-like [Branchiostoma lanceolatum]|uniref:cytochrome P450 2D4-like n=1 Tax=Branchiostoma lanceolatum TaxID=7740 RepID=UPI0034525911
MAAAWITERIQEILQISGLTLQSFLIFCAAILLAHALLKRRRNLPPYPAGRVPVLGHLLALGRVPHLKLTEWRRQYGDVFTVRMGMDDVVVLNGYTAVKDALVDRSELFASRPQNYLLDTITGFGKGKLLFTIYFLDKSRTVGVKQKSMTYITAARWGTGFRQRKRFATTTLKNLGMKVGSGSIEEKIREEANVLRNRIADYNGQPFDIAHDVTVAVANIICPMVFGRRYDYEDETFRELSEAIATVFVELGAGQIIHVFPLLRFVPVGWMLMSLRNVHSYFVKKSLHVCNCVNIYFLVNRASINALAAFSKVQNVLQEEISRHREHLDRENPRDFLDFCLLELEEQEKVDGLTEQNVLAIALNLFFVGTHTTTNTLLWSLLYMSMNPDIQNKVQEELVAVVGESLPTLSHRSQLPYVNACLLESMRIRHIGPLINPHATTETVKVQGYEIPKGTMVQPNMYSVRMDPAYWPDPDRFDPGRFLDAERNVINKPESFLPFGGGRRGCLGEPMARMELFLFFSTLLQSFTFRTTEGVPPPSTDGVFGATLTPHPFQLCVIPR